MTGPQARGDALTRAEVLRRLRRAAAAVVRGDHQFLGSYRPPPPYKAAAVLVPIVDRAGGLTVLLTQRTDHLTDHAGQISFPGGRIEDDDPDPEAAALREAKEEVGLDRAAVELVGRLDTWITGTRYEITPVVGLLTPPFAVAPDPFEVAEVFEVPLAFVLDPAHHEVHEREVSDGARRAFYVIPYQDRYIWGATAGMLVNLSQRLAPP